MSQQVITTILFELLDFAIRQSTNRHGDQEKYLKLREDLRKSLVAKINIESTLQPREDTPQTETTQDVEREEKYLKLRAEINEAVERTQEDDARDTGDTNPPATDEEPRADEAETAQPQD